MNRFRHRAVLGVVHAGDQYGHVGSSGAGQLALEFIAAEATDRHGWKLQHRCVHAEHSPVVRSNVTAPRRWNRPSRNAPRATSAVSGAAVTEMTRSSPAPAPSQSYSAT